MTQINTFLSNNRNILNLFKRYFNPNGYEYEYERNIANNILGYLSLSHSTGYDADNPYCPFTYRSVYMPYYARTMVDCLNNTTKDTIVVYRGTDKKMLKEEDVKVEGFVELNTASCPLNQFLTVNKNIVRVFQTTTPDGNYSNIIFVDDVTEVFIDKLFSSIPKLIPSLYPDGEIPQDEFEIFKSLAISDYEPIEKIIKAKCEELNVAEIILRRTFDGYENITLEKRKAEIKSDLDSYKVQYDNYVSHVRDIAAEINRTQLVYNSLCNSEPQNSNSFVNFLLSHKNIVKCDREDSDIYYVVDETIEYFADDMFEAYYNNEGCGFMQATTPEAKTILRGLFLKQYGKLRVYAEFYSEALSTLNPLNSGNIIDIDYSDHFVHPHLGRYRCLGANELPIDNYLKDGEWDMAIEQSIAATKNINFGDSAVMSSFVRDINGKLSNNGKFIIANNGQLMTLKEFVQYVEQLEKEEEKPEEKKEDEQTNQTNEWRN